MKKYIETIDHTTGKTVKRTDITGMTDIEIKRIKWDLSVGMNREKYFNKLSD